MAQIDEINEHGLEVLKRAALMPDDSKKWQLAVRTTATGEFTQSGLSSGIKTRCFTVTDVATPIPPSAFTNRNTILFRNHSSNIVYIGDENVKATRSSGDDNGGYEVDPNSTFTVDIKATTLSTLYAVCETGKTALCKTLELA